VHTAEVVIRHHYFARAMWGLFDPMSRRCVWHADGPFNACLTLVDSPGELFMTQEGGTGGAGKEELRKEDSGMY
jgi:hypothetical protein